MMDAAEKAHAAAVVALVEWARAADLDIHMRCGTGDYIEDGDLTRIIAELEANP